MASSPALLDTLAAYVPARIVRRIAVDPTLPTEPVAEHFPAAVFFADISGFSQRAGQLAQGSPSGGVFHCDKARHNHVAIALPQAYNQV
jgi:hypothetical protein